MLDELLILGPVLRRVSAESATVWVQTSKPARVRVRAGTTVAAASTFTVYGLHFALVIIGDLPPDAATPYQVEVDGVVAWPPADYPYPAPVIRTPGDPDRAHIVFGSCRESTPYAQGNREPDALDAYAVRLAGTRTGSLGAGTIPDLLMLVGDQVYADVTSKSTRAWLRRRRPGRRRDAPPKQVVDFAEYARLYRESWTDPDVRWLLSTVSTVMIFDDHEIIDDWNSSISWRRDMREVSWWPERIAAGLASYWVFQHAGNLDPAELPDDPVYRQVIAALDATDMLHAFAAAADASSDLTAGFAPPEGAGDTTTEAGATGVAYRWSFAFDLGRTRVAVLDNRCARVLTPGRRRMLSPEEWAWFAEQAGGDYDHLVIGASLPWLMPFGIHDVEAASERWAESRSRPLAAFGEWLRRTFDLEHWPAFGASFDDLAALLATIGAGAGRLEARAGEVVGTEAAAEAAAHPPPASISVLSGDVHHSYVARAAYGPEVVTPVHQLTCSPIHNRVPAAMRPLMRLAWHRRGKRIGRVLARRAGVTRPLVSWHKLAGPYFGNAVATLRHDGTAATVTLEGTNAQAELVPVAETRLSGPPA